MTDDVARGTDGGTGAEARLEAHAGLGALGLAQLSGLKTAAAPKVALTALVVGPTRSWFHVIQRLVTHMNHGTTRTEQRLAPTSRLRLGRLTHGNIILVLVVRHTLKGLTVLALHILLAHGIRRETKKTRHDDLNFYCS
jgi:hypothetical protein|mmetsp:Transcript_19437/g.35309  ORF Transcript_19437/g.35309 Transcript_19437/m.35309 type:complete len:139 (+) Transcript_19437:439-855(+)